MSNTFRKSLAAALASRPGQITLLLLLSGAGLLPAAAQTGCTVTVTSTADTGAGSLRDAVSNAAGGSTICVTATGTITLASALSIYPGLTVTGPGASSLTLSGNNVLLSASDSSTAPIAISNLTVANSTGAGVTVGGGVTATLSGVVVSGNQASGINNSGTLTVVNSTISGNTITQNSGGGIYNQAGGTLTLTNCTVSSNNSGYYPGGGLENDGTATITGGTFSGNKGQQGAAINTGIVSSSQGAVLTVLGGTQFLNNSAVGYGGGGALLNVYNYDNSVQGANVVNITGATFSGNTTKAVSSGTTLGGAIYNAGQMTVRESTFFNNSADGEGGAIYTNGTLTLAQDTVTANTSSSLGSGLAQEQTSATQSLFLVNTIISGNTTDDCDNCGTIPAGNLVGGSAMLGPLAANGGVPQTVMPLPGSVAIAGGVYSASSGTDATDERGFSRTTTGSGVVSVDIGAVQTHYKSVTFLQQPPASVAEGATLAPAVEAQVTEQDGNKLNNPMGVPVTLSLLPAGSNAMLSGTLVQYPSYDGQQRVAASFGDLSVATPGTYNLQATTYPSSQNSQIATYSSQSSSFTVDAPTPTTVSWSPASLVYGTPLPSTELNATVSVNGGAPVACGSACAYTFAAGGAVTPGTVYGAGSYPVQVTYTSASGSSTTGQATLTITKATPTLTLPNPPVLLPGARLSPANLHVVATGAGGVLLAGSVTYSPALGTALKTGSAATATFTAADTADYVTVSQTQIFSLLAAQVSATTLTASPNPALPGASVVLSASVAPAAGIDGVVPGTVAISDPSGSVAGKTLALDQANASFKAGAIQAFTGYYDYSTASADFNGDGVADLLIVPAYGALGVELSQIGSTPALGAPVTIANFGSACSNSDGTPTSVIGFAVGDANGDGLPDIAIACQNSDATTTSLVLLLNEGAGNFTPSVIRTLTNSYAAQIVFGDFNADGRQDLVLVTPCPATGSGGALPCLDYLVGNGDGTFAAPVVEPLNNGNQYDTFANLLTGDFNKDGKLDIALIHYPYVASGYEIGVVEVWKNNGGTFGTVVASGNCTGGTCYTANASITAGDGTSTLSSLVSADFNVDGLPDLALVTTANQSGSQSTRSVALNTGSAGGGISFPAAATDVQTGSGLASLAAADFDGDRVADLAFYNSSDNTVRVLHGAGDGTFAFVEPNLVITLPAPGSIGEAVRAPELARAAARRGAGPATPRPASSYFNGSDFPQIGVGDVNGDGTPDLLVGVPAVDQNGFVTGVVNGQQFVVNGNSVAATTISAPAGSTTYTAAATPSVPYWAASSGTTVLGSTSLATQTSLSVTPSAPVYGQAITLSASVTNTVGSTVVQGGSVTFTASNSTTTLPSVTVVNGAASLAGVVLPAGTHVIGASYTGGSGEGNSSAPAQTLTVAKAAPVVAWATPAAITTTTPLSAAQLDATAAGVGGAALPGSFVYTPGVGTLLSVGSHTLSVTFTPTDATDYTPATGSVQIQVTSTNTQTTLAIAPSAPYTYGQALTLSSRVTNTTGSTVVQGGTVTFTSGATTLASVTVVNGAALLPGVLLTAGTHVIGASYTGPSGEGNSAAASQTISIAQYTPRLTWAPPAAISTTTPLSTIQLDAAAAGLPGTTLDLPGTYTYTPAAGTTLSAGTHTLSVLFTPTDGVNYSTATDTVQIQVASTATRTTLAVSPASSTYGQPLTLTAHVANTTGSAVINSGTVTFTAGTITLGSPAVVNGVATVSGVILAAGQPTIVATYGGTGAESSSSASASTTIGKATSVLTWATPGSISSTTPLSGQQLDATAAGAGTTGALPGTFTYTPAAGTTLSVGKHMLSVSFTPTDAIDYTVATAQVTINVVSTNTQTTLSVTPAQITYGQAVALAAQVTNTSGSAVVQSGSVVFASDNVTLATVKVVNGAASLTGVSLSGGTHTLTASYTGSDGEGISGGARSITVAKVTPTLAWATPAQITTTTPLSGTQLNASASGLNNAALPGSFVYTPAAGTLLTAGGQPLAVTFTPTDAVDYAVATAQVTIQVVAETITLTSISPATTTLGSSPLPVTLTGSGFPATAVVRMNGTTLATTVLGATQLGATVPSASLAKAGSLSFTIYDPRSQASSNALVLSVTAPTPTVVVTAPATVVSGAQPSVTLTLTEAYPVEIDGVSTLTFAPAGPDGIDDPNVQFASGGRTYDFKIQAGVTDGPTEALQVGTVEGTVSVSTVLTAGGTDVTPSDLSTPTAIGVPAAAPVITGVTFTNANGLLTVVVTGYSNTREMTQGEFVFTGPGAVDLAVPGVDVPATGLFGTWYTNPDSDGFGSTFTYTQTFQLSDATTKITGVTVTLSNTVGTSASVNSQ